MSYVDSYWNPILETLPSEGLQKLQFVKFCEIFKWAYEKSPFYRQLYRNAGIEPGDIRTWEDIQKVPKIEKSMMRTIQGKEPFPYGDMLCVPLEEVTAYHRPAGPPVSPYIRRTAGMTGSSGLSHGHIFYMLRDTGHMIEYSCPSVMGCL